MKTSKYIFLAAAVILARGVAAQPGLDVPDEVRQRLLGQWSDEVKNQMEGRMFVYRFELDESGRLVGFAELIGFSDAQQGASFPIANATVDGDHISFDVPSIGSTFDGEFRRNGIVGKAVRPNGLSVRLSLTKGPFTIPYALDLVDEQASILRGTWVGEIDTPQGTHQNIFRFVTLSDGRLHGYLDNPTLQLWGMVVRNLSLQEGVLRLATVFPPGDFRGEVSGGELTGMWRPAGARQSIPARYRKVD